MNREMSSAASNESNNVIMAAAKRAKIEIKSNKIAPKNLEKLSKLSELPPPTPAPPPSSQIIGSLTPTSVETILSAKNIFVNISKNEKTPKYTNNKLPNNQMINRKNLHTDSVNKFQKLVNRNHSIDTVLQQESANSLEANTDNLQIKQNNNNNLIQDTLGKIEIPSATDILEFSNFVVNDMHSLSKLNVLKKPNQRQLKQNDNKKIVKSNLPKHIQTQSPMPSTSSKASKKKLKNILSQINNSSLLPIYPNKKPENKILSKDLLNQKLPCSTAKSDDKKKIKDKNESGSISNFPQLFKKEDTIFNKKTQLSQPIIIKQESLFDELKTKKSLNSRSVSSSARTHSISLNKTDNDKKSVELLEKDLNLLSKLPVLLPYPETSLKKTKKQSFNKTTNNILTSEEKSESSCSGSIESEPDFIAADIDLDLPSPYMLPVKEDDLKHNEYLRTKRKTKQEKSSHKNTDTIDKIDKLVDDGSVLSDVVNKTSVFSKLNKQAKSNETQYNKQKSIIKEKNEESKDIALSTSYLVNDRIKVSQQTIEERVHKSCLINRPDWDSSPMRPGDLKEIPLNWNIGSSHLSSPNGSFISTTGILTTNNQRRSKSSGDMQNLLLQNAFYYNYKTMQKQPQQKRVVTFDEKSIELAERSRSMLDVRKEPWKNRLKISRTSKLNAVEAPLQDIVINQNQHKEWLNHLKDVINSRTWLDFD